MRMPMYFVDKIKVLKNNNNAQLCLIKQIHNVEFRTIKNDQDLEKFEKYLHQAVLQAHGENPRTKLMSVSKTTHLLGGYEYNFHCGQTNYNIVATVNVILVKGYWEGGIK